jgi:hypothetical protein
MHYILVLTFWLNGAMIDQHKSSYPTDKACHSRAAELSQEFGTGADGTKLITACVWAP